ncbi:DMT family transporter [Actinomycetospora cinnamomea]|uniref:Threonine/homoserine efflux transporter RhtA n=1 Tax=Actinomycetospora cinnamomea TaxID=663609 RepID=A0A2U1F0Y7_9PSEU|nr:DMT family transporter [Actinomycetospora cinnamomea]PVZ05831.1 threonine/homoserine efflux transporter RhtA [Actinomycetospora cinnamomea]
MSGLLGEAGLLLVAVVGISFSAPLAAAAAVPALSIAFWRTAMASAVLAPLAVRSGRVTGRDVRTCALAGVLLAVHFGTWIPSLLLTSVATSTALVCTTPLWTAVLTRLVGGRVPGVVWAGGALALTGVVLVAGVDLAGSPRALLGDALALLGGVAMAGYLLVGAAARARLPTVTYTLLCYATAALTLLVVVLVAGQPLVGWPARGWLALVGITVCGQFLGHTLLNRALRTVGAPVVAVVSLLEVPGAAVIAALWLGERLAPTTLAGLMVLLAGVALVAHGGRGP